MLSRAISFVKRVARNSFSGSTNSHNCDGDTDSENNTSESATSKSFTTSMPTHEGNTYKEHHSESHINKNIFSCIQPRSPIRLMPNLPPRQYMVNSPVHTSTPIKNSAKEPSQVQEPIAVTLQREVSVKRESDCENAGPSDADYTEVQGNKLRITSVRSLHEELKEFGSEEWTADDWATNVSYQSTPSEIVDFTESVPRMWRRKWEDERVREKMEEGSGFDTPSTSRQDVPRTRTRKCLSDRKRMWLRKKFYVRESRLLALVQNKDHALHKWAHVIKKENIAKLSQRERDSLMRILSKLVDFHPVTTEEGKVAA